MVNPVTGEAAAFDCGSWSCVEHGPWKARKWMLRLGGIPWETMLTFTRVLPPDEGGREAWHVLARLLRRWSMDTFVRVEEFGPKTGMRHWHVLQHGAGRWLDGRQLETLRRTAGLVGIGQRVHTRPVESRPGAVRYLVSYALKEVGIRDARRRGFRAVTCSRNVPSWKRVRDQLNANQGRPLPVPGWELVKGGIHASG